VSAPIAITLDITPDDLRAHLITITICVPAVDADRLDAMMPTWTPGSYLMREYGRFVQDFSAADANGAPLAWRKTEKHRWTVDVPASARGDEIELRYRIYGHDLSVRAVHADTGHVFVNGPSAFMLIEGRHDAPHTLTVHAPEDWRIFTALDRAEGEGTPVGTATFEAPDYTLLVDCPLEIGPHAEHVFEAAGVPHRLVFWGDHRAPIDRLLVDLPKIIEAAASLFGGLPYARYLIVVLGAESGRGGLEHLSSTILQFPVRGYNTAKAYEDFLALVAHEHFHVWNVKRIRPAVLGPFDYGAEAYTGALWLSEGITCYYENLILTRAGLMTPERALELLAERWASLLATPGRLVQSVQASSFDAWIKLYRPHESNVNTTVSYYLKGELVGALLDLELRRRTAGQHTLHDVMLRLWSHYTETGAGFDEAGLQGLMEQTVGLDLSDFFNRFIRGTDELPLAETLAAFGLRLQPEAPAPDKPAKLWLGVTTGAPGDRVVLETVKTGSPGELAGLCPQDELVAIDRFRVTSASLDKLLDDYRVGDTVEVHLFRRGQLMTVTATLGQAPPDKWKITPIPDVSEDAVALRTTWIGQLSPPAAPAP